MEEQYLTEKHYLTCTKGAMPKQMKVTSQNFTYFSGNLAATEKDTLLDNNFICVGSSMFAAGMVAGLACCLVPGPGWVVAAIIAAALVAVAAIGYFKCKSAAGQRKWTQQSQVLEIQNKKALMLSSIMVCPAEGGTITPKETFWAAMGSQTLTNLGHLANFAFGFLAGRGLGAMAGEAWVAGAAAEGGGMAAINAGAREFGKQFLNTARKELLESFTFKGIKNAPTFCKIMRGLGIGGAYYEQYNIWSSDKSTVEKLKESSVGLILSIFAAKGATLVCFPAGTRVHTPNGLAKIEDLQIGDRVLTYNEETKEQEYKPITQTHQRYTLQMTTLELPTGEFLEVTPEHRFYSNGNWIEAQALRVGDTIETKEGHYTTICSIETLAQYQKVYNFDVQDNTNYYVTEDGLLVHNGYDWNIHHTKERVRARFDAKGMDDVELSANANPIFKNSKYIYSGDAGEAVVKIKLTGKRVDDFKAANEAAGFGEGAYSHPSDYTWHHVDDFDYKTGEATMELVETKAHQASCPHKGSANQYAEHHEVEYD